MKDLCIHFHYRLRGRDCSQSFLVPAIPVPKTRITLPADDPEDPELLEIEWEVQPTPARWEFARGGLEQEQLTTHVHVDLEMATGQ